MRENIYSLISVEDFKSIMGVDDRDDKNTRFCLTTATLSIEQYCMRKFLRKKYFEFVEYSNDLFLPLKEYPVTEILALYVLGTGDWGLGTGELIETDFYRATPDYGNSDDLPCSISLSPVIGRMRSIRVFKVVYWAGYAAGKVPADLSAACMELAAWNMNRYKSRQIGMNSNQKNLIC